MTRFWPVAVLLALPYVARAGDDPTAFFEKRVRPVLAEHCQRCHGDKKQQSDLRLDGRDALLKGGVSGPAAVPGKPDESLLIQSVRHAADVAAMPPNKTLPDAAVADLVAWVQAGAVWPAETVAKATSTAGPHWAFQPLTPPPVPASAWGRNAIDAFVAAEHVKHKLTPASEAEPRALLRRLTQDLTGLPPTPAEADAFAADPSAAAYAAAVERLLASPACGERWGRHWLDVVRYVDVYERNGLKNPRDYGEAFRYRDWVIAALNRDLPYDQFVRHQVAGDFLFRERPDECYADGLVATGMLFVGEWGRNDSDNRKMYADIVDDQIDVVSKAFLGLTVTCARCHDHKFDPITAKDYAALQGIFYSSHILPRPGLVTSGPDILRVPLLKPEPFAAAVATRQRLGAIAREQGAMQERALARIAAADWPLIPTYLDAAFAVGRLPAEERAAAIATVAAERSLDPFFLKTWLSFLRLVPDDVPIDKSRRRFTVNRKTLIAGSHLAGWLDALQANDAAKAQDHARQLLDLAQAKREELIPQVSKSRGQRLLEGVFAHPDADLFEELTDPVRGLFLPPTGLTGRLGDDAAAFRTLGSEQKSLEATLPRDATLVHAIQEGGIPESPVAAIADARVHLRGSYARLGDAVPRGVPAVLNGGRSALAVPAGESGRRQLADFLAAPGNPLTARVIANRVWGWHFGTGWSPRPTTSASRGRRRRTRRCSTGSPAGSCSPAGRSRRCTATSSCPRPTDSRAGPRRTRSRPTRTTRGWPASPASG